MTAFPQANQIATIDFRSLASKVRKNDRFCWECLPAAALNLVSPNPQLPQLRSLHLQDNPVATNSNLIELVKSAFPNLLLLNGEAVALFHVSVSHIVFSANFELLCASLHQLVQDAAAARSNAADDASQLDAISASTFASTCRLDMSTISHLVHDGFCE